MLESNRRTAPSHWERQTKCLHTKGIILNSNFLCLSYRSATFALQHGAFVPREWLAAKGLLSQDFIGTLTWKTPSRPSSCRDATHFRPPDFCLWEERCMTTQKTAANLTNKHGHHFFIFYISMATLTSCENDLYVLRYSRFFG